MEYKGYYAKVEYDDHDEVFYGRLLDIEDVISFEGQSVKDLKQAFREAVDDYLDWCRDEGVAPNRSYSGKFNVRLSPELHRRLALTAELKGESLNAFVTQCLEQGAER